MQPGVPQRQTLFVKRALFLYKLDTACKQKVKKMQNNHVLGAVPGNEPCL